ncbi:MAG TPA: hypothetical protein VKT53_01230 [Candidatus Acidoferrum sp.]|nr:hypothetical protein [Candidatus Acidoferrum sp.]
MISLRTKAGGTHGRHSRFLAVAICLASAAVSAYWTWKSHPTAQEIARAEDEVYEAVVREVLPMLGQSPGARLVFDDSLIVGDVPWVDAESCKMPADWSVQDKRDSSSLSANASRGPSLEVVESYRKMRCVGGRLSHNFHTDAPHSFIDDALFDQILPSAEDPNFARLFPGASGVLGFSHAGFNKRLDEAIVSTSFHCGVLCGGGHRFYLKKASGRWIVVSKRMTWAS